MHPMFTRMMNQNPWSMMPTRDGVGRFFYASKIPVSAPASRYTLSGLGALGDMSVVPGVSFKSTAAGNDFLYPYGMHGGCEGRKPWPGVSPDTLAEVSAHVAELEAAGASTSGWKAKASSLVSQLEQLEQHDNFLGCGRSDGREDQYYSAKVALRAHLVGLLSVKAPGPAPSSAVTFPTSSGATSSSGGAVMSSAATKSSIMQYLPIGIAVLAIGVVGYKLFVK